MKRIVGVWALLALVGFSVPVDDEADVRATFEAYKAAALVGDAQAAVVVLDSTTHAYYGAMVDLALHADRDSVEALNTIDLLMVLSLRHRVSVDRLRSMDGTKALVYALEKGWIDPSSVRQQTLGTVRVEGDRAYGEMLMYGQPSGVEWAFSMEDGEWKLDLTSLMDLMAAAFDEMVAEAEQDRVTFLFDVLGMLEGTRPTDSIWTPVAAR